MVEGAKPIFELLQRAPGLISTLVISPGFLRRQSDAAKRRLLQGTHRIFGCTDSRFGQLSDVDTPAGILAVVRQPEWDRRRYLERKTLLGIFCDRIQDPTNLGTIIRTAAGLAVDVLWLSPQCVDVFNPKVVRATAGALLELPIFARTDLKELSGLGLAIMGADVRYEGSRPLRSVKSRPSRTVLAIGNEGEGLSAETRALTDLRLTIPLKNTVESLNAASAAAIFLFHLTGLPVTEALENTSDSR
ncbi:MAG TPA: RNA methyltransferase [Nitrospiraceae bacterium]|nr:RNA methyltransferase [Nitrospiraceae bacterium]